MGDKVYYEYSVQSFDGGNKKFSVSLDSERSKFCFVERLAEHYCYEEDGYEDSWPIVMKVWKECEYVGKFEVNKEMAETFFPSEICEDEAKNADS